MKTARLFFMLLSVTHTVHLPLKLGGVGVLEFKILWGGQNIFDFRGVVLGAGGIVFTVWLIHPSSVFSF